MPNDEIVLLRVERDGQVYELIVHAHSPEAAGVEFIETQPRVRITRAESAGEA